MIMINYFAEAKTMTDKTMKCREMGGEILSCGRVANVIIKNSLDLSNSWTRRIHSSLIVASPKRWVEQFVR